MYIIIKKHNILPTLSKIPKQFYTFPAWWMNSRHFQQCKPSLLGHLIDHLIFMLILPRSNGNIKSTKLSFLMSSTFISFCDFCQTPDQLRNPDSNLSNFCGQIGSVTICRHQWKLEIDSLKRKHSIIVVRRGNSLKKGLTFVCLFFTTRAKGPSSSADRAMH